MPRVADPALLALLETSQGSINKNVNVSEGPNGGVGPREAATREGMYTSTPQLRSMGRDLATAQMFNQRIPTGRFAARVSEAAQQFPSSWQPDNIADYQSFMGLRQSLTKPVISLTAPSGQATSSKEMDTPKELELAQTMIPGPEKEKGANEYLINRTGRALLDRLAFNAFTQRWQSKYGSAYGKSKAGQTAAQAWAAYQQTPAYKKTVLTPYTQLLQGGGRPPAPQGASASPDVDAILKKHGVM
jgi:hypothetical protein